MPMNDNSVVSIMQSLGLNYGPAEAATKSFENRIAMLNKQLFDMKAAAIGGARDINQAYSSLLGGMGGGKSAGNFASQYAQSNIIFDQHGNVLKKVKTETDNLEKSYGKATRTAKQHGEAVQDVAKKYSVMGSEFSRRAGWFISGGLFYGAINGARLAVQSISDVEMGITKIARVTNDATFSFNKMRDSLLQLGVDYGTAFANVQDIALRWTQAGYNVADTLELTKTALLAMNTAELNPEQATSGFIAIMSQWGLTAKDLLPTLDKINKVGDDFAITSQDLVDGLNRSGGAAKLMGLNLNQTIAILTTMREATGRTGKETGNALNSILSYMQRASSLKAFEGLGIRVFAENSTTQFRNVMEVFSELAAKWNDPKIAQGAKDALMAGAQEAGLFSEELAVATIGMDGLAEVMGNAKKAQEDYLNTLTDVEKRDAAQAAAGIYRRNYWIGLIERWATVARVQLSIDKSSGYSMRENARTMETLEKKYEALKVAAQELAVALGDAGLLDILKGLTDGAKDAADGLAKMDPKLKSLLMTSLEVIGLSAGLKGVIGLFTDKKLLFGAGAILPGWTKLLVIIPALIGAFELFENNAKAMSDEQMKSVADLAEQYETLKSTLSQSEAGSEKYLQAQEEINQVIDKIIKQNPDLIESYDEATGAIRVNEGALLDIKTAYSDLDESISQHITSLTSMTDEQIAQDKRSLNSTIETLKGRLRAYNEELTFYKGNPQADNSFVDAMSKAGYGDIGEWISENIFGGVGNLFSELYDQTDGLIGNPTADKIIEYVLGQGSRTSDVNEKMVGDKEGLNAAIEKLNEIQGFTDESRPWLNLPENIPEPMRSQIIASMKAAQAGGGTDSGGDDEDTGDGDRKEPYKNPQLDAALKLLGHQKAMNEISLEDEVKYLKNVSLLYAHNADERMDLEERVFDAGKALQDKRLQDSVNWINQEKEYGKLSTDEIIAAWERVKTKQVNNAEAVKVANKGMFDSYKELLGEQQKEIEKAYDDRMDDIDAEAKKQKDAQDVIIKGIEAQEKALDRSEDIRDYGNQKAELEKELAYWSVRTSLEAEEKKAEIKKQLDELEHDRSIELQKQGLSDKKDAAQEEIKNIEKKAEEQKTALKVMWTGIQDIFNENNTNLIANAATTSQKVAAEYAKIGAAIRNAFQSGNLAKDASGNYVLQGGEEAIGGAKTATQNTQIKALAEKIVALKQRYDTGDKTAATEATSIYSQLQGLGSKGQTTADQLRKRGYAAAKSYVEGLPKLHSGGETMSYGMAYVKPGEFFFPPSLSADLKTLIAVSAGITGKTRAGDSYSTTDNRKSLKFDSLLRVENMHLEDEVDATILSRELKRELASML